MININSNLPNMSDVIIPWFLDISFEYVERVQQGADWIEQDPVTINTKGVVQPPSPKDLKILPEGSWSWEWLTIHCLPDMKIEPNQYVIYDGTKYKVMSRKDWSKYGFIKYILLEAFIAEQEGL